MAKPNTLELCRTHLFEDKDKLVRSAVPAQIIDRIIRLRSAYMLWLAHPLKKDAEIRDHLIQFSGISKTTAYEDIGILKTLLGDMNETSKSYIRFRFNAMIMNVYYLAEQKKDTRSMDSAAAHYAKYNRLDAPDEQRIPWDEIIPQRFEPTSDPSVIGIQPVPNIQERIRSLKEKYIADIQEVDYEEADADLDELIIREKANGIAESDIL
jgi:hypothetical protein